MLQILQNLRQTGQTKSQRREVNLHYLLFLTVFSANVLYTAEFVFQLCFSCISVDFFVFLLKNVSAAHVNAAIKHHNSYSRGIKVGEFRAPHRVAGSRALAVLLKN